MTLPLFLLEPGRLDRAAPGDPLVLDGAEGRHAATVRRIRAGEAVLVADGRGRCARAEVVEAGDGRLSLVLREVVVEPEPSQRLVLVQALAKGDRDEDAVEAATELGVDEVVPWQASRSVVVWRGARGEKSARKWVHVAEAAAKQSRRSRVPVVAPLVTTAALARRVAGAGAAYVLHEEATVPLAGRPLPGAGDVLVVVGPEGGIAAEELDLLQGAGAVPVRLGTTVLRSSTAGPAALAVLSAQGRWR
jgi:16S rRNA (uracil1498-N3)-methyltransferase